MASRPLLSVIVLTIGRAHVAESLRCDRHVPGALDAGAPIAIAACQAIGLATRVVLISRRHATALYRVVSIASIRSPLKILPAVICLATIQMIHDVLWGSRSQEGYSDQLVDGQTEELTAITQDYMQVPVALQIRAQDASRLRALRCVVASYPAETRNRIYVHMANYWSPFFWDGILRWHRSIHSGAGPRQLTAARGHSCAIIAGIAP